MPQTVRTVNQLIINSLYLIGELGVGEPPDAFMLTTGLDLVNEILDSFAADSIYIPYLTTLSFTMTPGKPTYSISDMIIGTDITADRVVDLSFANYVVPGLGAEQNTIPITSTYTADSVTSYLTLPTTAAYPTGTPVVLQTSGSMPLPLVAGVTYYTILISATQLQLALSEANALANIPIAITSDGTPTNTITFYQGVLGTSTTSLSYPVYILDKAQYYNVVRENGLVARPGFVFLDKQATESFITYYPAPDQPYPATVQVKAMINQLTNQNTLGELPPYYYGLLKYALGQRFISYYPSGNWPPQSQQILDDYFSSLKNANETDLTIRPSVTLTAPEPFYWPNILSY
jgi:hypothetical protein